MAAVEPMDPDHAEQEFSSLLDNAVPSRGYTMLPMVGIGGSAGSIPALQTFFGRMPADSGMAFVVILHLLPEHESMLAELLQRCTAMPVVQVNATAKVEPGHVYVIPPGKVLAAMGNELQLAEMPPGRGRHVAVDLFFRTLADTYGPHAVAIVLSGADSDGAIGIRRIKERGGLTIAQDPEEAEHSGMPSAAIATRMVDWILPVAQIAGRLMEFRHLEERLKLPAETGPPADDAHALPPDDAEAALRALVAYMRTETGLDMGSFRRSSIVRRVARRMQINGIEDLPSYLALVHTRAGEAGELRKDLLVSVTNFFRDGPCFTALAALLPSIFAAKARGEAVRAWVPACATGEEAYSVAMLLAEQARTTSRSVRIQVFASDLDDDAIQVGREALFPEAIAADVSEERLARFFVREARGYRVRRELRELVLFAVHDVLTDAPFARLDLLSCRNLLISLDDAAVGRALALFHFALNPDGILLLGASETVPPGNPYFAPIDETHRIYRRLPVEGGVAEILAPVGVARAPSPAAADRSAASGIGANGRRARWAARRNDDRAPDLAEAHLRLIERFGPPSLVIDDRHEVLHLSRRAGRFLSMRGGQPSRDLFELALPALRAPLRAALQRCAESGAPASVTGVTVELDGVPVNVDIRVSPAGEIAPGCHLVEFREAPPASAPVGTSERASAPKGTASPADDNAALEREIARLKAQLRTTFEQHEVSIEELKASNEELQAMNEELRSATEELETGREELQSINEEVSTVNAELKQRVEELGVANSSLHNLMGSTAIPMVFLDANLRVTLFTPPAVELFHLIPADVGRPLADLAHRLDYAELLPDASRVLASLVPVEREVGDEAGRWYLARVQPYRSLDDHMAGVVLTFTDITARRRAELALLDSRAALEARVRLFDAVFAALPEYFCTLDTSMNLLLANRAAQQLFGRSPADIVGRRLAAAGCPAELAQRLELQIGRVLASGQAISGIDTDGLQIEYRCGPARGDSGAVEAVVCWWRELPARAR